jgi:hypothetical protein
LGRNLGQSTQSYDVVLTGPNGRMKAGDVLTGGDISAWTLENGIVKVTKTALVPNPVEGGLTMKRWDGSTWQDCFGAQYGDWCFFANPLQALPDSVTVLEYTTEAAELAIEWTAHSLDTGYLGLGGVLDRDWSGAANYDNGAQFKIIDEVRFIKTIRLERGKEGYYVGYHSVPYISPKNHLAGNNETGYGERETGHGEAVAVFWASSGFVSRHPEWGANSNWGGGSDYSTQRHAWARIDDPNTSAPYINADYIAYQNALDPAHTFPAEQTTGPWWVADLPYTNATTNPVCRYTVMADRLEVACWQFAAGDAGRTVIHFVNELLDDSLAHRRFQVFIGAFPYTSVYDLTTVAGRANEPTATLKTTVARKAAAIRFDHL